MASLEDRMPAPPMTTKRLCKNYALTLKSINRFLEPKDRAINIQQICVLNTNLLRIICHTPGYQDLEVHTRNAKKAIFAAKRSTVKAQPFLRDAARFAAARRNSDDWKYVLQTNNMDDLKYKLAKQRWESIRLVLFALRRYKERENILAERRLNGLRVVLSVMRGSAERQRCWEAGEGIKEKGGEQAGEESKTKGGEQAEEKRKDSAVAAEIHIALLSFLHAE
jgi:hypothetical protein